MESEPSGSKLGGKFRERGGTPHTQKVPVVLWFGCTARWAPGGEEEGGALVCVRVEGIRIHNHNPSPEGEMCARTSKKGWME